MLLIKCFTSTDFTFAHIFPYLFLSVHIQKESVINNRLSLFYKNDLHCFYWNLNLSMVRINFSFFFSRDHKYSRYQGWWIMVKRYVVGIELSLSKVWSRIMTKSKYWNQLLPERWRFRNTGRFCWSAIRGSGFKMCDLPWEGSGWLNAVVFWDRSVG